ncbi:MAG: hypothetical protein ABEI32_01455, partial [Halothece sp.]
ILNPTPLIRGDLWAEDGRDYFADTIRLGFGKAFYANFVSTKGYPQFLKFALSGIAIEINQLFWGNTIVYFPHIASLISYVVYSSVFCLPIILFSSFIIPKYRYALPIVNCFIAIGSYGNFVAFGRILNIGFLSIYLGFLLVAYRLINEEKIKLKYLFILDCIILLCVFTQPVNFVLVLFLYFYKIYKQKSLIRFNKLLLLTIGLASYTTLMLLNNSIVKSYGESRLYDWSFISKAIFGRMIFNNFLGSLYSIIPNWLPFMLFLAFLTVIYHYRSTLHGYGLYALLSVVTITAIWRSRLSGILDEVSGSVYAMPSLLITMFLTFSLLSQFTQKLHSNQVSNGIFCFVIFLFIANGMNTNQPFHNNIETISLERSLELAQPHSTGENNLYKVPINPEGWFMLLPKEYIKHD